MRGITHLLAGAACVLLFTELPTGDAGHTLLAIGMGALAALLPDLDHPGSIIRRRSGAVGSLAMFWASHRGFTHTYLATLIVAVCVGLVNEQAGLYISIGYVSHISLDMLTQAGLKPFFPVQIHLSGPFRTGGFFDRLLAAVCAIYLLQQLLMTYFVFIW